LHALSTNVIKALLTLQMESADRDNQVTALTATQVAVMTSTGIAALEFHRVRH
jgi:hypothetical protein